MSLPERTGTKRCSLLIIGELLVEERRRHRIHQLTAPDVPHHRDLRVGVAAQLCFEVHVDESGDCSGDCSQVDQPSPGLGVELTNMTKREPQKKRAPRRRREGSHQELLHAAVSEQRHVIKRVWPVEHSRDQRGHFPFGPAQPGLDELPKICSSPTPTPSPGRAQRGNTIL